MYLSTVHSWTPDSLIRVVNNRDHAIFNPRRQGNLGPSTTARSNSGFREEEEKVISSLYNINKISYQVVLPHAYHCCIPLPPSSIVILFIRSRALTPQLFYGLVFDPTPETICVPISKIRKNEMKPILCLTGNKF
jgi:hypothetical protein